MIDFAHDNAGRLEGIERPAAGERVDFTYDGRSFLSQATQPWAFFQSPSGDSIFADGFESGDFSTWSSCFGGLGCGPSPPQGVTLLYDSAGLMRRIVDQNGDPDYVFYLAGRPVAQMAPDVIDPIWTFLTTDHLGTPVMASDETGLAFWQGGFEPFGGDFADARGAGIFLRLPGQWWDSVWEDASLGADLYYNVHRWYEYGTGRYTRPDPKSLAFDVRNQARRVPSAVYGYANSRPVFLIDLLGLEVKYCTQTTRIPVLGAFGFKHSWLKIDRYEAGMGQPEDDQCACPYCENTDSAGQS